MIFPYWPVPGPTYYLYVAHFAVMLVFAFQTIRRFQATAPATIRKDISKLFLFTAVAYLSGNLNNFLWFNIPIKPYFNFGASLCLIGNGYVYFKTGLLDLQPRYRQVSLYFLIYLSLLAVALAVAFPITKALLGNLNAKHVSVVFATSVSLGFLFSLGPVFYAHLVRNNFWLKTHHTTGLTHELKSPLCAITGAAEMLSEQLRSGGWEKESVSPYVHMIQKNAGRMEEFVKSLLAFAKIQTDSVSIQKTPIDFSDLAAKVVDQYEPLRIKKGLIIHLSGPPAARLAADPEKMEQVLSNLLSNAVKFTDKGRIHVSFHRENGSLECSVRDEGSGIPAHQLPKIFDRFFHSTHSNRGAGIGLTIAKAWVEAHGGKIWAESEGEGKGTKVTFTLPL